ncbi:DUF4123 domain-containing protein [Providencia rettgeri]|nr:DUF4123 domain-containing protein [Providencia rettgeri]MBO1929085.1 DUF4123 domain-containing protein [Providencia rettgeri]
MVKPETCYAVIDAASEPDVFNLFAEHEPPASCLYSEPIQPEIVSLAPYLVEVTEEVQRWLSTRETPWEFMFIRTQPCVSYVSICANT